MQVNILPDLPNLLPQIASTIVLFLIIRHFAYQPLLKMLAARADKVYSEMEDSKQKSKEAQAIKEEYQLKLEDAKGEARDIVESAKARGDRLEAEMLQTAKQEAQKISDRAMADIEREKQKMLADLKSEVVEIAMLAATKVIEKDLDPSTHKTMINKFIDEVGESQWKN